MSRLVASESPLLWLNAFIHHGAILLQKTAVSTMVGRHRVSDLSHLISSRHREEQVNMTKCRSFRGRDSSEVDQAGVSVIV